MRVFELRGLDGETDAAAIERFETGLARCFEKQWRDALDIFESLPDDPVARVYAARCKELLDTPGQSWDTIWNLASK